MNVAPNKGSKKIMLKQWYNGYLVTSS